MGLNQQNFEQIAAESYLAWWCDAGVDVAIGNMPHDWLGSVTIKTEIKTAKSSPVARPMPQTLEAFVDDLMTGDIADAGPASRRVRPAGNPASDLMILTDFPDAEDIISGELLGDPLFTKMLTAMGRSRASVLHRVAVPGPTDDRSIVRTQHCRARGACKTAFGVDWAEAAVARWQCGKPCYPRG